MKNYKVITITHKDTNIRELGDFLLPETNLKFGSGRNTEKSNPLELKLRSIMKEFNIAEMQYLSTCNRLCYFFVSNKNLDHTFIKDFFEYTLSHLSSDKISNAIKLARVYEGKNAINHIFEVVSSINSLVVGEREILKQYKDSYYACREMNLTGDALRIVYKKAVTTAKETFLQTDINKKPVSIVSLAIKELISNNVSKQSKILLIGAGQTNLLVSKFLLKHNFKNISVYNRTIENAEKIARKFKDGSFHSLDDLKSYSGNFDILISCINTNNAIIDKGFVLESRPTESSQKILIDLGVPQNIDNKCGALSNVKLIDIEYLKKLAVENICFREKEVKKAKTIILKSVEDFYKLYKERQIELAMSSLPDSIKDLRLKAIEEVFGKEVKKLDPYNRELIEKITGYMEKKYIGIPMRIAKEKLLDQLETE
ncbi:MAG: glutamyl-tRNA reductase [Chitinophagaceae bacterium]|nr:MAG: glutamyl-tRNA reductase [Chitinophagaceae bacterium]